MKWLKSLSETKTAIWAGILVLAIYSFLEILILRNELLSFEEYFSEIRSNLDWLSMYLTFVSLKWIYDTKESITAYQKKYKFQEIVHLTDLVLTRDTLFFDPDSTDLLSKIYALNRNLISSELIERSNAQTKSNTEISIEEIAKKVVEEYTKVKSTGQNSKIKENLDYVENLKILKEIIKSEILGI